MNTEVEVHQWDLSILQVYQKVLHCLVLMQQQFPAIAACSLEKEEPH